jgi:segregation and condensation protein B
MEELMSSSIAQVIEEAIGGQPDLPESSEQTPAGQSQCSSETNGSHTSGNGTAGAMTDWTLSDLRALRGILEALLFVATDPIPITRFVSLLGAVAKSQVEEALTALQYEYEQEGRGLQLVEVAGGYKLVTKAEFAPWLKRMEKTKAPAKLSRSALESLAIIAYKQPIVRGEIEQIRGVETSGVLRTLLERKLVRIVGRKEEPGRPIMYGTTKFFLEHFGLRDLSQLPPLREFKELGESEQAMLPIEESAAVDNAIPEEGSSDISVEASAVMSEDLTPSSPEEESDADLMVAEGVEEA